MAGTPSPPAVSRKRARGASRLAAQRNALSRLRVRGGAGNSSRTCRACGTVARCSGPRALQGTEGDLALAARRAASELSTPKIPLCLPFSKGEVLRMEHGCDISIAYGGSGSTGSPRTGMRYREVPNSNTSGFPSAHTGHSILCNRHAPLSGNQDFRGNSKITMQFAYHRQRQGTTTIEHLIGAIHAAEHGHQVLHG